MITPTDIKRYGIASIETSFFAIDDLFSGSINDPSLEAEIFAHARCACYDVVYIIMQGGKLAVQLIFFRNKSGYDLYKQEDVLLFNDVDE